MSNINSDVDNCCCCSSPNNLFNILEPMYVEDKPETCMSTISKCFGLKLKFTDKSNCQKLYICENCIHRLEDALHIRLQIEAGRDRVLEYILAEVEQSRRNGTMQNEYPEVRCYCCFGNEDLSSMLDTHYDNNVYEKYSTLIMDCFHIQLKSEIGETFKNMYMICKVCVERLKAAINLRFQIQTAYDYLKGFENKLSVKKKVNPIEICENSDGKLMELNYFKFDNCICDMCRETFEREIVISHDIGSKPNADKKCYVCSKSFTSIARLKLHIVSHLNLINSLCDTCHEVCKSNSSTHEPRIREECGICNAIFTSKSNLTEHIKTHYNDEYDVVSHEVFKDDNDSADTHLEFNYEPDEIFDNRTMC